MRGVDRSQLWSELLRSMLCIYDSVVHSESKLSPGAAKRYAPRRWQFDSRRIYVRSRTGSQSAHGYAAGSQRAYSLGQLRAYSSCAME